MLQNVRNQQTLSILARMRQRGPSTGKPAPGSAAAALPAAGMSMLGEREPGDDEAAGEPDQSGSVPPSGVVTRLRKRPRPPQSSDEDRDSGISEDAGHR